MYLEYGIESGKYEKKTPTQSVNAGEAAKFLLDGLRPGKTYYYRVRCTNPGMTRFGKRKEHSFTTLRKEGEVVKFVYGTDSHYYILWAGKTFGGGQLDPLATYNLSIQHMLAENADFQVIGGDWAMTQCDTCPGGTAEGVTYAGGSAATPDEALKRYIQTFSPGGYGAVSSDLPFTYILGNHDGEAGFQTKAYPVILSASQTARQTLFPNAPVSYRANDESSYYYFDSGDARFIFLDVMRYTLVEPVTADDWTLGSEQLAWLENTLKKNTKKWVFIFSEHLDGGEESYSLLENNYWYGRGGLRATLNDLPTGTFNGEQAVIQTLEEENLPKCGAIFSLHGHDHVAITPTEKLTLDGNGTNTYHLNGGRMGSTGLGWADTDEFKKESDWDLDGKADYNQPDKGTKKPGYFRITVNDKNNVVFDYIQSDKNDPTIDGTIAFSKTVYAQSCD
jgi:hypothetical protein